MNFEFPDPVDFPGFLQEGVVWEGMPIPQTGMPIVNEMRRRVESARNGYNSLTQKGMPVHSTTADVSALRDWLKDEIEEVKAYAPAEGIKNIDRSKTYSGEAAKSVVRNFLMA